MGIQITHEPYTKATNFNSRLKCGISQPYAQLSMYYLPVFILREL